MIHREFCLLSDCTIWANIGIGPFIKECTKLLTNCKIVYINTLEVIAKVRNLPFDKLRVNGLRLKSLTFSVRGELVEPQKNTFAIGSLF